MKKVEEKREMNVQDAEDILQQDYAGMLKELASAWEKISDEQCALSRRLVCAVEVHCTQVSAQVVLLKARLRLELARYAAHIAQYGDPLDRLRRTREEWAFSRLLDAARKDLFKGEGPALTDAQMQQLLQELMLRNMFYAALEDEAAMRGVLFAYNEEEADGGSGELPRLALQDAVLERLGYLDYRSIALMYRALEPCEEA